MVKCFATMEYFILLLKLLTPQISPRQQPQIQCMHKTKKSIKYQIVHA